MAALSQVPTTAGPAWSTQLQLLLESTGEGIYGIDMAGCCTFVNRAAAQMIGLPADQVLGRNMHYLIHHRHADGRPYPEVDCPIFAAFRRGESCRIDREVLWRADGSAFAAEYSSHPIMDAGQVRGAVVTFVDITERRQAEEQLRDAHDRLEHRVAERTEELTQALGQLRELSAYLETVREQERTRIAREIHDELGSLLVALRMDVNWLARRIEDRPPLQGKCQGMGELIDTAVDKVGRIINDLRPSILDHQGLWAAMEWQALDFLGAAELQHDLKLHVEAGVPLIEGPQGERWAIAVFRIFQEMLSNVVRHAQASAVSIRLYVDSPPKPVLHLEVRDDGIGAASAALDHPHSYGVMGMRERAGHFGGEVEVRSTPGQGTRVRLTMPLPDTDADAALGSADDSRKRHTVIRVLVCDDHVIVRRGIKQILADAEDIMVANEADNGPDAIQQVRHAPTGEAIDVVLMDIAMPQRDGLDVLKQLKREFPKLPVLMLSTYPDRQYAVRSLKLGAVGYLNKSADSQQMIEAIRKVAQGKLFITPSVAEHLAEQLAGPGAADRNDGEAASAEAPLHERLSHREYQVFRLLAGGRSVGEIAEQLSLSPNTVSTYRARILEKTGVRNDVELALYAVRHRLLEA